MAYLLQLVCSVQKLCSDHQNGQQHIIVVQILTSKQEAFLDSHCYPWCPDMWQMAQLLAAGKAEPDVKECTSDLDMSAVALKALLPDKTGFQLLTQPLRARGLGLRLKRRPLLLSQAVEYLNKEV